MIEETHAHPHAHEHDQPMGYHEMLATALVELLVEKGLFTPEALQRQMHVVGERSPAGGARVVAHAWLDDGFKARLLANGSEAITELGFDPGAMHLAVVENTPEVHNVIVCTLCSCYPRMLLGVPPAWYKSSAYRSRVVREPRAVLREFGLQLPEGTSIRVHDSTADLRYLVLPLRPADTDGLDEAALAALVTQDAMIGTAIVTT